MDFSMFENMNFASDYRRSSPVPGRPRFPQETPLAMAYVPLQMWGETYSESEVLCNGTLFPELNLPFEAEEGCYGQR